MLDALISLPILSFFALPILSSYSTSLNILFFYMTWTTLVLSHTPLNVEIYGTLFIRLIFYVLPGLLFLALDTGLPSLAVGVKAHGDAALPARYGRRRVGVLVAVALGNVLLGVAAQVGVELLCTRVLRVRSALKIATHLPVPWAMAKDLFKAFLVRNTLAYYVHRYLLHRSRSPVASLHMAWHHSIFAPFSLAATYDHPIPYLLGHWLPTYLPAFIFRFHILTYQLFLALVSLEDLFTYSGYSVLPSTIILTGMARRTDAHMISGGKGNFAPWGILDWVHGTTVGKDVMEDVEDEMEKHDVKGRTNKAMDSAGEKMKKLKDGKGKK